MPRAKPKPCNKTGILISAHTLKISTREMTDIEITEL